MRGIARLLLGEGGGQESTSGDRAPGVFDLLARGLGAGDAGQSRLPGEWCGTTPGRDAMAGTARDLTTRERRR